LPEPMYSNQVYWIDVTIDKAGYDHVEIDQSSDICARGFFEETAPSWSNDPYTFKLADPILGIISFNPNAQNRYEYTAFGKRPIKASIDYRIYDPRIIREDKVVPDVDDSAERIPVKLALRFILDAGEPGVIGDGDATDNPDEPTFEGLMREYNGRPQLGQITTISDDVTIKYSVIIVDLKTGLRVGVPLSATSSDGAPLYTSDFIDYKTGVVNLPGPAAAAAIDKACLIEYNNNIKYRNVDLRGRNLRFLYRADGDWSVQCQKAYSYYSRVYDAESVNYYRFYLTDRNRLLFAPCDAGKTVSVDYTYVTTGDNVEHRVVGQEYQISDTSSDVSEDNGCYYVNISVPTGSSDEDYTITRVSVIGTSFMARVIWRDGKNWRHVDLNTNLVRDK
jgi:hypothetical protein